MPQPEHLAAATASLAVANGNMWSLATVPLILAASRFRLDVPRFRWFLLRVPPLAPDGSRGHANSDALSLSDLAG
jgi:hypothetical protein